MLSVKSRSCFRFTSKSTPKRVESLNPNIEQLTPKLWSWFNPLKIIHFVRTHDKRNEISISVFQLVILYIFILPLFQICLVGIEQWLEIQFKHIVAKKCAEQVKKKRTINLINQSSVINGTATKPKQYWFNVNMHYFLIWIHIQIKQRCIKAITTVSIGDLVFFLFFFLFACTRHKPDTNECKL